MGVSGGTCPGRLKRSRFHGIAWSMPGPNRRGSALLGQNKAYLART